MSPCRSDYIFTDEQIDVWHVVSEDSDHFTSWLAVIHGLGDLDDLEQPTNGEVRIHLDHLHALYKLSEIELFGGPQRIPLKEGNHHPK